jgi:hypothetical protein
MFKVGDFVKVREGYAGYRLSEGHIYKVIAVHRENKPNYEYVEIRIDKRRIATIYSHRLILMSSPKDVQIEEYI